MLLDALLAHTEAPGRALHNAAVHLDAGEAEGLVRPLPYRDDQDERSHLLFALHI